MAKALLAGKSEINAMRRAEEKRALKRQLTSGIVYHVGTTGSKLVYRAIFLCFHARRVRRGTPSRARM